ncbi:MAG: hypothetical protein IPM35_32150 [Myxococcales bacterium]|nr:hypothetical protein [Myxococcales bacterium]
MRANGQVLIVDRTMAVRPLIGVPAEDAPGLWYALSPSGKLVALSGSSDTTSLWQVGNPEPTVLDAGPVVGGFEAVSWGAPRFLGEDTLVTHHTEGIVVWDLARSAARCFLTDPLIHVARETFDLGMGRAAVRSGSNSPGVSNASLVECSTTDCRVLRRLLVGAGERHAVAAAGETTFILLSGAMRVIGRSGETRVVTLPTASPHALRAFQDGALVWAADAADGAAILVGVMDPKGLRSSLVGRLPTGSSIVRTWVAEGRVHAVEQRGALHTWPAPDLSQASGIEAAVLGNDALAREHAILELAAAGRTEAIAALSGPDGVAPSNRFFEAYLRSLVTDEAEPAFLARLARDGIRFRGEAPVLAVVEDLARSQAWAPACDLLFYWMQDASPCSLPEAAVPIALELALQLSEADQDQIRGTLIRKLGKLYPNDARVAEALSAIDAG